MWKRLGNGAADTRADAGRELHEVPSDAVKCVEFLGAGIKTQGEWLGQVHRGQGKKYPQDSPLPSRAARAEKSEVARKARVLRCETRKVKKAMGAGSDDYDTKPIDLKRLLGKINAWLEK